MTKMTRNVTSNEATACCTYIVQNAQSKLVFAKSKVKPIKEKWTTPKLEMQALRMGVENTRHVLEGLIEGEIKVNSIVIMTDSEIALKWLESDPTKREVGVLIANRLKSIRTILCGIFDKHGLTVTFGHADTKRNPADLGTRGVTKTDLDKVTYSAKRILEEDITPIFDCSRTNSFMKMKRVTVRVLKFILKISKRMSGEAQLKLLDSIPELNEIKIENEINAREVRVGEQVLVRDQQKLINSKKLKEMANLKPQMNEKGIVVCKGRMSKADLPIETKEPILLLQSMDISKMIIREAHGKSHKTLDHTMIEVRRKFWIPKLRTLTKSLLSRCVWCQRMVK
uniref:Integrase_H2C2 domain-containing protein n=1 Tax=Caenorhabditis japonica TaxID=281687 RepID=A0A8R1HJA8_CAEJA